jgi:hypothetical protein
MARGKDLAGLAALGALGMMLSKRKGKEGADTSGMDTGGFEGIKELPRRDTGMSEKEPGAAVRPDENYGNEGRRTGPVGVGKAPVRAAPASVPSRGSLAGMGYKYQLGSHPEYYEDEITKFDRDAADKKFGAIDTGPKGSTYKKGGAVKKMASGGMASSASKRADGIAQKGKTKGRMC